MVLDPFEHSDAGLGVSINEVDDNVLNHIPHDLWREDTVHIKPHKKTRITKGCFQSKLADYILNHKNGGRLFKKVLNDAENVGTNSPPHSNPRKPA